MSVKVESEVYRFSKTTLGTRLVMLAIADNADEETRTAWPSIKTLGEKARLSESAVHRAIRKAVEMGELSVTERPREGNRHASNVYRVNEYPGGCQNDTQRVTPAARVSVARDTQRVSPAAPEPSVEPSENHQKRERASSKTLPENEKLTREREAMAKQLGIGRITAEAEWQKMSDHEFRTAHRDWDKVWRNWCRRVSEFQPRTGPGGPERLGKVLGNQGLGRAVPDVDKTKEYLRQLVSEDRT